MNSIVHAYPQLFAGNLHRMKILVLFFLVIIGCTPQPTRVEEKIIDLFDSLAHTPVKEGYVPVNRIDFSHATHAILEGCKNCTDCHKTPNKKVSLSLCY